MANGFGEAASASSVFSVIGEDQLPPRQYFQATGRLKLIGFMVINQVPSGRNGRGVVLCLCAARGFWDTGLNPTPPDRRVEAASVGRLLA